MPKIVTATARTANISTDADIVAAIDYIKELCAKIGRTDLPQVICSSTFTIKPGWSAQEAIDHYGHLQTLGVHGSGASVADSISMRRAAAR